MVSRVFRVQPATTQGREGAIPAPGKLGPIFECLQNGRIKGAP